MEVEVVGSMSWEGDRGDRQGGEGLGSRGRGEHLMGGKLWAYVGRYHGRRSHGKHVMGKRP